MTSFLLLYIYRKETIISTKVYSRGRVGGGGGGVELHVKSDGDARGKIKIKPLREANVGVVLA